MDATLIDEVIDYLARHQEDVDAGRLVWATLPTILEVWRRDYDAVANIFDAPDTPADACGGCEMGMLCCTECGSPRCVADCRSSGTCINQGTCNQATGLCE